MSLQSVLFDFDGTLADSGQCAVIATQQAFREHQLPAPPAAAIVQHMGIPIERCFRSLGAADLDDIAFAALLATFRQHYAAAAASHIHLYPGISDLLAALKAQGRSCGIISSKKAAVLRDNCAQLGIVAQFDVFVGSDDVRHYKPHPEGIERALAVLACPAGRAIYVGDAVSDIAAGRAAGVQTCAVTWGAHDAAALAAATPDFLLGDVADLQRLLLG